MGQNQSHFNRETWRKIVLHKTDDPILIAHGSLYQGLGCRFASEEALQTFLNTYCGFLFPNKNEYTVWCYREQIRPLPHNEWDALPGPAIQQQIDGRVRHVKIQKDVVEHIVYRYYPQP